MGDSISSKMREEREVMLRNRVDLVEQEFPHIFFILRGIGISPLELAMCLQKLAWAADLHFR